MEIFLHILTNNIVPIFMLIGLGLFLGKKFSLNIASLSKLNFYAFLPVFCFVVIYTNNLSEYFLKTLSFLSVSIVFNTIFAVLAARTRRMTTKKKYALINSVILFNSGNIGIPLITLIFRGTAFEIPAVLIQLNVMLIQSIITNSLGFYNAGRGNLNWKDAFLSVLKMPTIWAIFMAIFLKQFNLNLESTFIWPPLNYLKNGLIGFVLLTLGVQLSKTRLSNFDVDVFIAVSLRLIAAPLAAYIILRLLNYTGLFAQVLFISSALPGAINSALMAIEMNNEPEYSAKTVAFSTILCSITLVLVIFLAKIIFPI